MSPSPRLTPLVVLSAGLLLAAPHAHAEPRLSALTLSTAGVALIEARADLGEGGLVLNIPRARIDGFLQSLWVADPAGGSPRLSLPGAGIVADTFATLPLSPADLADRARLMQAMTGASVQATRQNQSWQGRVMGVSMQPCGDGQSCPHLALSTDGGDIHSLPLDADLALRFTDAADRAAIARALSALRAGADGGPIPVTLTMTPPEPRALGLLWLEQAPVWRTAWRAVDGPGGLVLTGWAVVENATGRDWEGVELTLATGAVRVIAADLFERRFAAPERAIPAPAPMMRLSASEPILAEAMAPAPITADDGDSFSRFTLSEPVTLAAGQIISLPFLAETLPDARLTLYQGGTGAPHPVIALELENPLPLRLPAGIITFYEEGRGHAGDARIPELAPGARETVHFATDTGVSVHEDFTDTQRVASLRIVDGLLEVSETLEQRISYRIEGPAMGARVLTLDHPRLFGWDVTASAAFSETPDALRFELPLAEGETVTLDVTETQPIARSLALLDMDEPTLAYWQGVSPDAGTRALLAELGALRAEQGELRRARDADSRAAGALEQEQRRLVDLIVQLNDANTAPGSRRARVDAIDAELVALAAAQAAREGALADLDRRIRALIRG